MKTNTEIAQIRQILLEIAEFNKQTAILLQENSLQQKETDRKFEETTRKFQETDLFLKETGRKIRELGKQIGGLGERFGSFTEGMAINSMERILRREFHADHVAARSKVYTPDGQIAAEYDILAWCNSTINNVVVVEVKSTLRLDYVKEFEQTLSDFKGLNPELANKNLYGILAFVGNYDKKIQEHCQNKGIYTATIHDEIFKLNASATFRAKNFNIS
jgi:hypothetical protein